MNFQKPLSMYRRHFAKMCLGIGAGGRAHAIQERARPLLRVRLLREDGSTATLSRANQGPGSNGLIFDGQTSVAQTGFVLRLAPRDDNTEEKISKAGAERRRLTWEIVDDCIVVRPSMPDHFPFGLYDVEMQIPGTTLKSNDNQRLPIVEGNTVDVSFREKAHDYRFELATKSLDDFDPGFQRILVASTLDGRCMMDFLTVGTGTRLDKRRAAVLNILAGLARTPLPGGGDINRRLFRRGSSQSRRQGRETLIDALDEIVAVDTDRIYARVSNRHEQTLLGVVGKRFFNDPFDPVNHHDNIHKFVDPTERGVRLKSFREREPRQSVQIVAAMHGNGRVEVIDADLDKDNPHFGLVSLALHVGWVVLGLKADHLRRLARKGFREKHLGDHGYHRAVKRHEV